MRWLTAWHAQTPVVVKPMRARLAFLVVTALAGCGGKSDSDSEGNAGGTVGGGGSGGATQGGAGSGGTGLEAGSGSGGSIPDGGAGDATTGPCEADPLSSAEKGLVRELVLSSIEDAQYILNNTHGTGAAASRGFGASVPTTELSMLTAKSPSPVCSAPTQLEPTCTSKTSSGKAFKMCTQLGCEAGNQLVAKAWIEPLPVSVPTIIGCCEPVGTTQVQAFEHQAAYLETSSGGVQVTWSTSIDLVLDNMSVKRSLKGNGEIAGSQPVAATLEDTLAQIAPGPVSVKVTLVPAESGTISYNGMELGTVLPGSIHWVDLCN